MYVYIIKSDDLYKIGKAEKPKERLRSLQTGNPTQLELLYTKKTNNGLLLEKEIHNSHWLKDCHVRGEWFKIPDYILDCLVLEYKFDCHFVKINTDYTTEILIKPTISEKFYNISNELNNSDNKLFFIFEPTVLFYQRMLNFDKYNILWFVIIVPIKIIILLVLITPMIVINIIGFVLTLTNNEYKIIQLEKERK